MLNEQFNKDIDAFEAGNLPDGYVFQLGAPSSILKKAGVSGEKIEMSQARLTRKSRSIKHTFEPSEIKNLVNSIQDPVAIFSYKKDVVNVIVEIKSKEKNFLVGLEFNKARRKISIADVKTIFAKDTSSWLSWITDGKLIYMNTEKLQSAIASRRTNPANQSDSKLELQTPGRTNLATQELINNLLQVNKGVKDYFVSEHTDEYNRLVKEYNISQENTNGRETNSGIQSETTVGDEQGTTQRNLEATDEGAIESDSRFDEQGREPQDSGVDKEERIAQIHKEIADAEALFENARDDMEEMAIEADIHFLREELNELENGPTIETEEEQAEREYREATEEAIEESAEVSDEMILSVADTIRAQKFELNENDMREVGYKKIVASGGMGVFVKRKDSASKAQTKSAVDSFYQEHENDEVGLVLNSEGTPTTIPDMTNRMLDILKEATQIRSGKKITKPKQKTTPQKATTASEKGASSLRKNQRKGKIAANRLLGDLRKYVGRVITEMGGVDKAQLQKLIDGTVVKEGEYAETINGEVFDQAAMKRSDAPAIEDFIKDVYGGKYPKGGNEEYFSYELPSGTVVDVTQASIEKNQTRHPLTAEQVIELLNASDNNSAVEYAYTAKNISNKGVKRIALKVDTKNGKGVVVYNAAPNGRIFVISTYLESRDGTGIEKAMGKIINKDDYRMARSPIVPVLDSRESRLKSDKSSVVSTLYQEAFPVKPESYEQESRGRITMDDAQAVIELFENADTSTGIHEVAGHLYLKTIAALASLDEAPAWVKNDWQNVKDFLGMKEDDLYPTPEQHEKFAKSAERYFYEGKAPNAKLQGIFDRFKKWLLQVYKSVQDIGVEITPEVREVFDHLFPGQKLIRTAKEKQAAKKAAEHPDMMQTSLLGDDVVSERDMETGEQQAFLNPDAYRTQKVLDGQTKMEMPKSQALKAPKTAKSGISEDAEILAFLDGLLTPEEWEAQKEDVELNNEVESLQSIRNGIMKYFGFKFLKKYEAGKLGSYLPNVGLLKTRDHSDIIVAAHETGHGIDDKYKITDRYGSELGELADKLPPILAKSYAKKELAGEAFAEFVRRYMLSRDMARDFGQLADGRNFVQIFEDEISKADKKFLGEVYRKFQTYLHAEVIDKMNSQQKTSLTITPSKPMRGPRDVTMSAIDKDAALVEAQEKINKALGIRKEFQIDPSKNLSYLSQRSYRSGDLTGRILDGALIDRQGNVIGDGFLQMLRGNLGEGRFGKISKKKMDAFNTYLSSMDAIDRYKMGKSVFSADITPEMMQSTVEQIEAQFPDVPAAAEAFWAWQDNFFKAWMVDAGLVSEELYATLKEQYPHHTYVQRVVNKVGGGNPVGNNAALKRTSEHGSDLEFRVPVESMISYVTGIVNASLNEEKKQAIHTMFTTNEAAQEVLSEYIIPDVPIKSNVFNAHDIKEQLRNDLMQAAKEQITDMDAFEKLSVEEQIEALKKLGNTDVVDSVMDDIIKFYTRDAANKDYLTVTDTAGEKHYYKILDPNFGKALNESNTEDFGMAVAIAAFMKRVMTAATTGANPLFALTNFMRDLPQSYYYGAIPDPGQFIARVVQAAFDVTFGHKGARRQAAMNMGAVMDSRAGYAMRDSSARGAGDRRKLLGVGYTGITVKTGNEKVDKVATAGFRIGVAVTDVLGATFEAITAMNGVIETIPRQAQFNYVYDKYSKGGDKSAAMKEYGHELSPYAVMLLAMDPYNDATVFFHRHGSSKLARLANQLTPFQNAAVQGVNKAYRALAPWKADKKSRLAFNYARVAGVILLGELLSDWLTPDDDEDKMNDRERDSYYHIKIGDNVFRIPKPRETTFLFKSGPQHIIET